MYVIYNQYSDNYDIKLLITEKSIFFVRILNALSCIKLYMYFIFFLLHHIYKKIL